MTQTVHALLSNEQPGVLPLGFVRMSPLEVKDGFWGLPRQMAALVGRLRTGRVLQQASANGRAMRSGLSGRPATGGRR